LFKDDPYFSFKKFFGGDFSRYNFTLIKGKQSVTRRCFKDFIKEKAFISVKKRLHEVI